MKEFMPRKRKHQTSQDRMMARKLSHYKYKIKKEGIPLMVVEKRKKPEPLVKPLRLKPLIEYFLLFVNLMQDLATDKKPIPIRIKNA